MANTLPSVILSHQDAVRKVSGLSCRIILAFFAQTSLRSISFAGLLDFHPEPPSEIQSILRTLPAIDRYLSHPCNSNETVQMLTECFPKESLSIVNWCFQIAWIVPDWKLSKASLLKKKEQRKDLDIDSIWPTPPTSIILKLLERRTLRARINFISYQKTPLYTHFR